MLFGDLVRRLFRKAHVRVARWTPALAYAVFLGLSPLAARADDPGEMEQARAVSALHLARGDLEQLAKAATDFGRALEQNDYRAAEAALDIYYSYLKQAPGFAGVKTNAAYQYEDLAQLAIQANDNKTAFELADKAVAIAKRFGGGRILVAAYGARAEAEFRLQDYIAGGKDARTALDIYLKTDDGTFSDHAATGINLSSELSSAGDARAAQDILDQIRNSPHWSELDVEHRTAILESLGLIAMDRGLYGEALSHFRDASALARTDPAVCAQRCPAEEDSLGRGALYFGNYAVAIAHLEKFIAAQRARMADTSPAIGTSMSYLVWALAADGQAAAAWQEMSGVERILAANPIQNTSHDLYNQAAYAYDRLGDHAKAAELWRRLDDATEPGPQKAYYAWSVASELMLAKDWNGTLQAALHAGQVAAAGGTGAQAWTYNDEIVLARALMAIGRRGEAAKLYRENCARAMLPAIDNDVKGESEKMLSLLRHRTTECYGYLTLALRGASEDAALADVDSDRTAEAFGSAQRSVYSNGEAALAHLAARALADGRGSGEVADAYEDALIRQASESRKLEELSYSEDDNAAKRAGLQAQLTADTDAIDRLTADITRRVPDYWKARSLDPVTVSDLQHPAASGSELLRENEALLVFVLPPDEHGLVFAVTKEHIAWARLKLTTEEIAERVKVLRAQIDPAGYGVTAEDRAALSKLCPADAESDFPDEPSFCREAAYEIYQAILGDSAIQSVVKDKSTWLFVPSGALTSLPPGLLVTAPPTGGFKGDHDPAMLRATAWLLRTKSIAVLPAVSSLRVLRDYLAGREQAASDPLLALTNPDFTGSAVLSEPDCKTLAFNGTRAVLQRAAATRADLRPLPGADCEGLALKQALHGGTVLSGLNASKSELEARKADGSLRNVRVLEFATHGLLRGDFGLTEPGLALAVKSRRVKDGDEDSNIVAQSALTASEAAALKLNAEWVILSACNTAGPDSQVSEGISGLARSFFSAGARAILVSHWDVHDDMARRLVPDVLTFERSGDERGGPLSRAQALRKASLAILDDATIKASHPLYWAPFVLVGDPGIETGGAP